MASGAPGAPSADCGGGGAHDGAAPVTGAAPRRRVLPVGPFPLIPNEAAQLVFAHLSQQERLCLQLVSPAWRDALRAPALWRDVDLSAAGFWRPERFARALQAVSRLAAGGMRSLRVALPWLFASHCGGEQGSAQTQNPPDALVATVAANAATLSELHVHVESIDMDYLRDLARRVLEAGPALQTLTVPKGLNATLRSGADTEQLAAVLSGQGVYAPLRVEWLHVSVRSLAGDHAALLRSLERHSSLRRLQLVQEGLGNPAVAAMVDLACAAARAGAVSFWFYLNYSDVHEFTAQAARLVTGFPVHVLEIHQDRDEPTVCADEFLAAVRDSRTLQRLELGGACFDDVDATAAVFQALTGHPTLRELLLTDSYMPDDTQQTLRAIAGLLASPSALTLLSLKGIPLDEGGMTVILQGLASPHARLQRLELSEDSDDHPVTPRFVYHELGAAVLRCLSMREVTISSGLDGETRGIAFDEAEVALRNLNELLARRAADLG